MAQMFQRIVLAARPRGGVQAENFRLESVAVPALKAGEVLVQNHFLSLDPYMRGRMSDARSYAAPQALDATMIGATSGVVLVSRDAAFAVGDRVTGVLGWAEMGVALGSDLRHIPDAVPLSAALGVAGMPGVTAWYGINDILQPKAGETLLVSSASGAVGGTVGQLAKLRGARAIGIAGGPEKCAYVVNALGFDACVDYKAPDFKDALKAATPDGVDCLFENVGGEVFDRGLARMRAFGRVAMCGLIAGYNGDALPIYNLKSILIQRLTVRGFIITEHPEVWPAALAELADLLAEGKLHYRETVAQGLAAAPQAFMGLLQGRNFGKQLVRLIP